MYHKNHRLRRLLLVLATLSGAGVWLFLNPASYETIFTESSETIAETKSEQFAKAADILEKLAVKGRAPKTNYDRELFYTTWPTIDGCNLRQRIIKREFGDTAQFALGDACTVISGEYDEPYTGEHKIFTAKTEITKGVQIDHVVALADAWQKGAQNLTTEERYNLATDPLNLLAVDASTNQKKSDGDAATWLPPNKKFRCAYVARQVSVKYKYHLWVTEAEKSAIAQILTNCPNEPAVGIEL